MREIKKLDEFQDLKSSGMGFLLITDKPTGNVVHSIKCGHVKEEYFKTKVIDEGCKNGNYFLIDDIEGALGQYNASKCQKCMK